MGTLKDIVIGLGVMLIVITGISAFFIFGVSEFGITNYPEINLLGSSDSYDELISQNIGEVDNSTITESSLFGDTLSGISLIIKQVTNSVKWLGLLTDSGGSITSNLPVSPTIIVIFGSLISGVILIIVMSIFLRWNV